MSSDRGVSGDQVAKHFEEAVNRLPRQEANDLLRKLIKRDLDYGLPEVYNRLSRVAQQASYTTIQPQQVPNAVSSSTSFHAGQPSESSSKTGSRSSTTADFKPVARIASFGPSSQTHTKRARADVAEESDSDDVVVVGGKEDWENAKRVKRGDWAGTQVKPERSTPLREITSEADASGSGTRHAPHASRQAVASSSNTDPHMPHFDNNGRLVQRPTEPGWGGEAMGESAKSEWLDRVRRAWIAHAADHYDWKGPLGRRGFFAAVLDEAQYTALTTKRSVGLFDSAITVQAFCVAHYAELLLRSVGFRANMGSHAARGREDLASGAQSQQSRRPKTNGKAAESIGHIELSSQDGSEYAPSESDSSSPGRVRSHRRGPSADQYQGWLGKECLTTLRTALIIETVIGPDWARVHDGQLTRSLLDSPKNKASPPVHPTLGLGQETLFHSTKSVTQLVSRWYYQVGSMSCDFAEHFTSAQTREFETSKRRQDRLSLTLRPTCSSENTLREATLRHSSSFVKLSATSNPAGRAAMDERVHHTLSRLMLVLGFIDPESDYKYNDKSTIRNVLTRPYTTIFKLADGINAMATIAQSICDNKDGAQCTPYESKSWSAVQVCLPILIERFDIYQVKLRKALVKDSVYPDLLQLLASITKTASQDQAIVFATAFQKVVSLRVV